MMLFEDKDRDWSGGANCCVIGISVCSAWVLSI